MAAPSREESAGDVPDGHVVMLLCAGQRNEQIPYCSGVCCMTAMRQAQAIRIECVVEKPKRSWTEFGRWMSELLSYGIDSHN